MHTNRTRLLICTVAVLSVLASGCIRRRMTIESDPPNARVFIDGIEVGETPVTVPFTSYGWREILLELDDHQIQKNLVRIRAPWYSVFPIDFFTDVLYPGTIRDERHFSYVMEPIVPEDIDAFRQRAQEFADWSKETLKEQEKKR